MNQKRIYKVMALTLTIGIATTGIVCAEPEQQTQEPDSAFVEALSSTSDVRIFGEEGENTVGFEFVNGTGKDISYLCIRVDDGTDYEKEQIRKLQEILIEQGFLDDIADGLLGPKTEAAIKAFREKNGITDGTGMDEELLTLLGIKDGNILSENDVIKVDETVIVYFDGETEDEQDDSENAFLINQEYVAVFRLAGADETEYVLHTLPLDETSIKILIEDEISYVEYTASDGDNVISTLENEKAIQKASIPEPIEYSNYSDGYYDDYSYDYSYDYSADYSSNYVDPAVNEAQGVDGCIGEGALIY